MGINGLGPDISIGNALLAEIVGTAALTSDPSSKYSFGKHGPLAIGFIVLVCHTVMIPIDGCSVNPARSFGPAVVSGIWRDQVTK